MAVKCGDSCGLNRGGLRLATSKAWTVAAKFNIGMNAGNGDRPNELTAFN